MLKRAKIMLTFFFFFRGARLEGKCGIYNALGLAAHLTTLHFKKS